MKNNLAILPTPSYDLDRKINDLILNAHFNEFISPWFISGFTDAEGNFDIVLFKSIRALAETGIKFRFRLTANFKDVGLLICIKNYFKCGNLSIVRKDTLVVTYEVSNIEFIRTVIIPFFDKYPLKGTKYYDYLNWKKGFNDFLNNRDSLESKLQLIERLKAIKSNLNRNNTDLSIPLEHLNSIDGNYISGLATGDGSFSVVTKPNSTHSGFGQTSFNISQKQTNRLLLEAICKFFGVGKVFSDDKSNMSSFIVSDKLILNNIIIPFFDKYPVYGLHSISFLKWKTIILYSLKLRNDKVFKLNHFKDLYITNVRNIWSDNSIQFYEDFSLDSKQFNNKISLILDEKDITE